ncbi:MAG TPA: LamG-like jellyroll fold domain-containing protein [Candidatus Paceibacterota bacterium]
MSIHIGGNSGANTFNGSIDDVRIYNRALSAGEITQLYNLGR